VYQVNNSVTFSGKPIVSEELLNQIVEVLSINISIEVPKKEFVKGKAKL